MPADDIPSRTDARSYATEQVLRDGSVIHIRAIRANDKLRLLDHFAGLSARTRYFRFFGHKRSLSAGDLARYTELDFTQNVGLAGTLWQNGEECFIGVGRYVRNADPSRAEIALAVLDEYQGAGIGPLLIRHLGFIAHENGITRFEANVRGDNSRMLEVLRKSGCILNHSDGGGIVHFTLQCPERATSCRDGGRV
jgi:GNAT superfamily N-acetyltransferase